MVVMDGSWIYNYLCNLRCEIYSIKHYVILESLSVICDRSVVFSSGYSDFLHQ